MRGGHKEHDLCGVDDEALGLAHLHADGEHPLDDVYCRACGQRTGNLGPTCRGPFPLPRWTQFLTKGQ